MEEAPKRRRGRPRKEKPEYMKKEAVEVAKEISTPQHLARVQESKALEEKKKEKPLDVYYEINGEKVSQVRVSRNGNKSREYIGKKSKLGVFLEGAQRKGLIRKV